MNWWYVIGVIVFPFYLEFIIDLCSTAYFDNKLKYQEEFFERFDPVYEETE